MDLDQFIYWVGTFVCCLIVMLALIGIIYLIGVLAMLVTGLTTRRLHQTYRHLQLVFFMGELEEKGKAQLRKDHLD